VPIVPLYAEPSARAETGPVTREEIEAAIADPPDTLEELLAIDEAAGVYLDAHPDDLALAAELEVIALLIAALEEGR
jgi:hypothetical protein